MNTITVSRQTYLKAPAGDSIYSGAVYAGNKGLTLFEKIRHESLYISDSGNRHYYSRRLAQRLSEDNGKTWRTLEEFVEPSAILKPGTHRMPLGMVLLPGPNVLISIETAYTFKPDEAMFGIGNARSRTLRTFYRISRDQGKTWSSACQVIDHRPGHDENHWMPGVTCGIQGGVGDGQAELIDDNTFLMGFAVYCPEAPKEDRSERAKEIYTTVTYAQARWNDQKKTLEWTFGETIAVPFPQAAGGCCEPALAKLSGGRWLNTMRCQGDKALNIHSRRMATISSDNGMTWSKPVPLKHDDDSVAWTPASFHRFFVSERTGKTYLIANFLPGPVHAQTPRYPLAIAEFDIDRAVVLKKTLTMIQDLPPGAPVDRRYTNFGNYQDRETGELVLTLPEHPMTKNYDQLSEPADYTGDCLIYRIKGL